MNPALQRNHRSNLECYDKTLRNREVRNWSSGFAFSLLATSPIQPTSTLLESPNQIDPKA